MSTIRYSTFPRTVPPPELAEPLVMVNLDHLVLAVPNGYRRKSKGRTVVSKDYENTCAVADTLYTHGRLQLPYKLAVIGY